MENINDTSSANINVENDDTSLYEEAEGTKLLYQYSSDPNIPKEKLIYHQPDDIPENERAVTWYEDEYGVMPEGQDGRDPISGRFAKIHVIQRTIDGELYIAYLPIHYIKTDWANTDMSDDVLWEYWNKDDNGDWFHKKIFRESSAKEDEVRYLFKQFEYDKILFHRNLDARI